MHYSQLPLVIPLTFDSEPLPWLDRTHYAPPCAAVLSIILLLSCGIIASSPWGRKELNEPKVIPAGRQLAPDLAKLFGALFLSVTSTVAYLQHPNGRISDQLNVAVDIYLFLLTVFSLLSPATSSRRALFGGHVSLLAFVGFVATGIRDIAPLALYAHDREVSHEWIIWARLAVLGLIGLVLPTMTNRRYRPVNAEKPSEPSSEQIASFFSLVTYSYLDPLIALAFKLPSVPLEMLPTLADYDESRLLHSQSAKHLDVNSGLGKRGVVFALAKVFRWDLSVIAFLGLVEALVTFMSPFGLNRLLNSLEEGQTTNIRPWVWILCMFTGMVTRSFVTQWYNFLATRVSVRAEAVLMQALYEQALRMRPVSSASGKQLKMDAPGGATPSGKDSDQPLTGRLNNLATSDLASIVKLKDLAFVAINSPVQLTLCMLFLYKVIGVSALAGLAVILIMFPISGYTGRLYQVAQVDMMKKADVRMQAISENLNILRLIKLFAWERKIYDRISEKRVEEVASVRKAYLLRVLNGLTNLFASRLVMVLTFATKQSLTPSIIFSSMPIFVLLQMQLHLVFGTVMDCSVGWTSLTRLTQFLTETELIDAFSEEKENNDDRVEAEAEENEIGFENIKFSWKKDQADSPDVFTLNIDGPLKFKRDTLNIIAGPTGSGKTSLLSALLGEMRYSGRVHDAESSWSSLPRKQGVAYAPQEPWIQNATIKQNILFQSAFEPTRYQAVLDQCGLVQDLTMFSAGDETEVGEKGLSLSGGQKARISLARAVYSQASILLLDDVFSALDVHTSRAIVDTLFNMGTLLKGRTVILVTHAVSLLVPLSGFVVSLRDGRVLSQGSAQEVIANDDVVAAELNMHESETSSDSPSGDDQQATVSGGKEVTDRQPKGMLIANEELDSGRIGISAWKMYFSEFSKPYGLIFAPWIGGFIVASSMNAFQTRYIGLWGAEYEHHRPEDIPVLRYFGIYVSFLVIAMAGSAIAFFSSTVGYIKASKAIHNQLILAVFGSTLRWLDTTPMSRIVTRCTQDMKAIDTLLPDHLTMLSQFLAFMMASFASVLVVSPAFVFPAFLLSLIAFSCGHVYMKAQLSTKRLMSNAKAPILSHLDASIAGLTSVRAYGVQEAFQSKSFDLIDNSTRVARTFHSLTRWATLRVDVAGATFAASLALYLVYFQSQDAATTGFSLSMATMFSQMILMLVQYFNNLEVEGNSLERIEQYLRIEQEPKPTPSGKPPAYWPASGRLEAKGLCAKYSSDGDEVLHDLSFEVKSGERVGVVGRTGSGKSSLTLSLLRCIPTEGEVYLDGLPTSSLNLDALRSAITIIPQMPELLSGSVRENLDPGTELDDVYLNDALRSSGLYYSDENRITLDTLVAAGGTNLSFGQRQMLAFARAMVRQSKLLILDEATSGIDYETDSRIQQSLRTRLPKDVTVLTIAHRLQTIMDADKIMVLDAGKIIEFDSPKSLLEKTDSKFKAMVDNSVDREALYAMVPVDV